MAVLQMQKISICALKKNRKGILEELQRIGTMEIIPDKAEDTSFEKMDVTGSRAMFERTAHLADQALDVLQEYAPEKKSLLAGLAGKELVEQETYEQAIREEEKGVTVANRVMDLEKGIAEDTAEILRLENQIESLTPWSTLDIPLNSDGTRKTTLFIGTMPGIVTLEQVYAILAEQAPDVDAVDVNIISVGKDFTYLTALCGKGDAAVVEEALRTNGFARPPQSLSGIPSAGIQQAKKDIEACNAKIEEKKKKLSDMGKFRETLRLTADYYRIRADKYQVLGEIPQSKQTFFMEGYVPEKNVEKVISRLTDKYDAVVEKEAIAEDEDVPVLLKNNKFAESAEGVLAAFGLPNKNEFDPTMIMSICYVFLFGLMLSDAAYGIIVSVACAVALLKCPRMAESMRKSLQLFFWCGLSTLFWGVMFGGYFGDAINVISRTFFGHEVGIPAVWFVPIDNPMKLLVYCMLFGVIHLYLGLALKGYMYLKDKDVMGFICDVVFWFCLLTGLIMILLPTDIFAAIAQTQIVFPDAVNMLAKVLAIGGAVGILLMSGRRKKNIALRLALGAYDLYNITGWLSDVLSYSRLLALGLATGVMASVFNQMGSMGGNTVVGVILFIVVFIIGHTFNMAINLLGAYVHTCRLQYVEFFGKFYEGGGREFHPFKANTKYVDIKED